MTVMVVHGLHRFVRRVVFLFLQTCLDWFFSACASSWRNEMFNSKCTFQLTPPCVCVCPCLPLHSSANCLSPCYHLMYIEVSLSRCENRAMSWLEDDDAVPAPAKETVAVEPAAPKEEPVMAPPSSIEAVATAELVSPSAEVKVVVVSPAPSPSIVVKEDPPPPPAAPAESSKPTSSKSTTPNAATPPQAAAAAVIPVSPTAARAPTNVSPKQSTFVPQESSPPAKSTKETTSPVKRQISPTDPPLAAASSPPPQSGLTAPAAAATEENVSIPRSTVSCLERRSGPLHGTISILNFDRTRRTAPVINSPRSLLACKHEGLDPNVDFLAKVAKDFITLGKGNNSMEMANIKLDHYNQRREQLIEICVKRRSAVVAEMDAVKKDEEAKAKAAAIAAAQWVPVRGQSISKDGGGGNPSAVGANPRGVSPVSGDSTDSGERGHTTPSNVSEYSSRTSRRGSRVSKALLSRKEKAVRSLEKMQQTFEHRLEKERHDDAKREELRLHMLQVEADVKRRQEEEDRSRRIRDAMGKKHDEELKQLRKKRERELEAKLELLRKEREARAEALAEKETQLKARREQDQLQQEYEVALKQQEVENRLADRKHQADVAALQRQHEADEKMARAEEQRLKIQELNDAQMEVRRLTALQKTEHLKEQKERVQQIESTKLGVYAERNKAVEEQQERIAKEKEMYVLHCRMEEAKKERLRTELLAKVAKEDEERAAELKAQVELADLRTKQVLLVRTHLTVKRRVEKELILEDRAQQQTRLRRVQLNEVEAVRAKIEEKAKRIEKIAMDLQEEEEQRRRMQVDMIRKSKKKDIAPSPGPSDYDALESLTYLSYSKSGVKICTAGRSSKDHDQSDTPGPGQYSAMLPIKKVGAKLPPKAKDLEMLSACVSATRRKSHDNNGSSPNRASSLTGAGGGSGTPLPAIGRRSVGGGGGRRSSTAPLVADAEVPHGVVLNERDYADSDDDFVRVQPLAM